MRIQSVKLIKTNYLKTLLYFNSFRDIQSMTCIHDTAIENAHRTTKRDGRNSTVFFHLYTIMKILTQQ